MATATVKGGLFETAGLSSLSQVQGTGSQRRIVSQMLSRYGTFALREKMETLNGVVPGNTAAKTLRRVAASSELGGVRPYEVQIFVSAGTVAGDVTEINTDLLSLSSKTYDPTPVANLDGNPLGTR